MRLTANALVHYLLARQLLAPQTVADGQLVVVERSRRNRNFIVRRPPCPGYFVKQVGQWVPQAAAALQREATCAWVIATHPDCAVLRPHVPAFHGHDAVRQLLILEHIEGSESLGDRLRRQPEFPSALGAALGRLLGECHRRLLPAVQQAGHAAQFPGELPWILQLPHHATLGLGAISAGNAELVRLLAQYPDFQARLAALAADWTRGTLIHGDLKWDNLLVAAGSAPDAPGAPRLQVIDWELADAGDRCWDIGAVLQGFLASWLASMPDAAGAAAESLVSAAGHRLEAMLPAIRAFWFAYREQLDDSGDGGAAVLARSVRCAGARMIQTAYEYLQYSGQVSRHALRLLQVSLNVLNRPQEAQRELLGL